MLLSLSLWDLLRVVLILFWGLCISKLKSPEDDVWIPFIFIIWINQLFGLITSNPNSCTFWTHAGHLRKVVLHEDNFACKNARFDWLTSLSSVALLMCAFGLCECSHFRADDSPPINHPRSTSSRSVEDVSSDPHVTNGSNRLSADLDNYAQVRV